MKADSGFERLCLISTYHTQFRNKFAGVRLSPLCAQASTSFVFGSPSGFWIFVELQHCLYPWRTRIFWTGTGCWGNFTLTGIPPLPRGQVDVKITFTIDADGILSVSWTLMSILSANMVEH